MPDTTLTTPLGIGRRERRAQLGIVEAPGDREIEVAVRRRLELDFDALAARLRHVEDHARRARAGRDGRLQIADVHVEAGDAERAVAVQHPRLDADLVVPGRLVLPGLASAERDEVLRRAQRHVERIVDAAEPEPARDLRVQVGAAPTACRSRSGAAPRRRRRSSRAATPATCRCCRCRRCRRRSAPCPR